jgi:hypothetical protein
VARIFISHSSRDKPTARRIAEDLSRLGHEPWLDEWEIRVGDCIPTGIELGVSEADYLVLVLSQHSTGSKWGDGEWKAKYWDEVSTGRVSVLPALIETCEIPTRLRSKRYADFRESYGVGLVALTAAIDPALTRHSQQNGNLRPPDVELTDLITKVQSSSVPLSETVTEGLAFAHRRGLSDLERLCKRELAGYDDATADPDFPSYRLIPVFATTGQLNMQYIGWQGDAGRIFEYMESNPEGFVPQKLAVGTTLHELEDRVARGNPNTVWSITKRRGDINPAAMISKKPRPSFLRYRSRALGVWSTVLGPGRSISSFHSLLCNAPGYRAISSAT